MGVERDYQKAVEFFLLAALEEENRAKKGMKIMYTLGHGVEDLAKTATFVVPKHVLGKYFKCLFTREQAR